MTSKNRKTVDRYRDADNGHFIKKEEADKRPPSTWVKERVPKPGNGIGR